MPIIVKHKHASVASADWNLGEHKHRVFIEDIAYIEATGPELAYIRRHFQNIPDCDRLDEIRWEGETARFIMRHIA